MAEMLWLLPLLVLTYWADAAIVALRYANLARQRGTRPFGDGKRHIPPVLF
jgi:hypothetical protein